MKCKRKFLLLQIQWDMVILNESISGMIVVARQGSLSISETADLLWFSFTTVSRVCREWCKKTSVEQHFCGQKHLVYERSQRRRARLVNADRKVTVTQITTYYSSGMQKRISEHTMHQTYKWIGYSRPISLKNKSNKYQIKCSLIVDCYLCCLFFAAFFLNFNSGCQ